MGKKIKKILDFAEIADIGLTLENRLKECSNIEHNKLEIYVSKDIFTKIDEDIYYRQFPDGKDFKPSDDTIVINFEYLVIQIKKKKEE